MKEKGAKGDTVTVVSDGQERRPVPHLASALLKERAK
jgi:hypothetical protein